MHFTAIFLLSMCSRQIMSYEVDAVTKPRILGEGPHWDDETQNLYFVDDFGSSIHRYDPSSQRETYCKIHETAPVSIVIPIKGSKNKFAVTVGKNLTLVTWDGETTRPESVEVVATVDNEEGKEKNQFNDGKVDPSGRLWVGTMGPISSDGSWSPEKGSLYSFPKGEKPKKHVENLSIANGLIWNKAQDRMFYIDSPTRRIDVFDFNPVMGTIGEFPIKVCGATKQFLKVIIGWCPVDGQTQFNESLPTPPPSLFGERQGRVNRRLFFDVGPHITTKDGGPDGMTIDDNDNLWFAIFGEGTILNVNGTTGEFIRRVDIPSKNPTSVAFGGVNLDELYITSATFGLTDEEKEKYPKAGSVFRVRGLGVKGRKALPADI